MKQQHCWLIGLAFLSLMGCSLSSHDELDSLTRVAASTVPVSQSSKLSYDPQSRRLTWGHVLRGDYDQNGEVNSADLAPIAKHFLSRGPFDWHTSLSVVDGDGNGEINSADIAPIASNFLQTATSYQLFWSALEEAYPDNGSQVAVVSLGNSDAGNARRSLSVVIDNPVNGTFYWVRPIHRDGEFGVPSNLVRIAATPVSPQAQLSASPLFGLAPLQVSFDASTSFDPDGYIVTWEFDADGPLIGSGWDKTPGPYYEHTYTQPGEYEAWVRVVDSQGLANSASVLITVGDPLENQLPIAVLQADRDEGLPPLTVNFSAAASLDPDGEIVEYRWDFGDGSEPIANETPQVFHTYSTAGKYTASVTVEDNDGGIGSAEFVIRCQPIPVIPPAVTLHAEPRWGQPPLTVSLKATASDSDGEVMGLQWDLNGDGVFGPWQQDTELQTTFNFAGLFEPAVRALDDDGNLSEPMPILIWTTLEGDLPLPDSIFALPNRQTVKVGEPVRMEVFVNETAGPFMIMNNVRVVFPTTCSPAYVNDSFNVGSPGGARDAIDGLWAVMGPTGFLLGPDSFISAISLGNGMTAFDFGFMPLGGSDLTNATGALINFEIALGNAGWCSVGFQRHSSDQIARTYYQDGGQTLDRHWEHDTNAGMPGITVVP